MTIRSRLIAFALVVVVAVGLSVGYLVHARAASRQATDSAPPLATAPAAGIAKGPRVIFRNTALGPDYGKLAMVSLARPNGPRAILPDDCDRVYDTGSVGLCLTINRGAITTYQAQLLNASFQPTQNLPLAGSPSRARLSADGKYAATTSFISGDSYAGANFSTRTMITALSSNQHVDLENFQLIHQGRAIRPADRNLWGVTFASDDDTFYATGAWGGHTWLVRGSMSHRTLTSLREDAECPSLSPDGTHVVYKKRNSGPPGNWHLAVLDLATNRETMLGETRVVDDQAEWLDNTHVLYGIPRQGSQAAIDDIYEVGIDGINRPSLFIAQAWSPSVVR